MRVLVRLVSILNNKYNLKTKFWWVWVLVLYHMRATFFY